ncbi:MAG: signal peptidase II [bacterium]|nr:signal peptidase II [bacterium]
MTEKRTRKNQKKKIRGRAAAPVRLRNRKKGIKTVLVVLFIVMLNIGCDQGTKDLARKRIRHQGTINVVGSLVILRYAENDGAFLSIGSRMPQPYKTILLVIFPIMIVIGSLLYISLNRGLSLLQTACLSSIIGGGISNIFDRILYNGMVTDFLNFGIGPVRTGILNCADLSITLGAVLLVILQYWKERTRPARSRSIK